MANKDFNKLSERQQNILRFIESYVETNGFPPTIRQIGEATSINSTSVVNYNLNKLKDAGYLSRSQHVSRGLRLTSNLPSERKSSRKAVQLIPKPIKVFKYGYIQAGLPTPTPDDSYPDESDAIEVTPALLGGYDVSEIFALEVKGESMIDAMIREGDIVLLKKQEVARNGDMVAAWLLDKSETTLKYFHKEGSRIRLKPAHPTMDDIIVTDPSNLEIRGKVVSVIRRV
jgi:repressor LexA